MAAADDAPRVVMANADELEKLDLLIGLQAYLAEAEHVMEPQLRGPCHQLMSGYAEDCRAQGLLESAPVAVKEGRRLGKEDERHQVHRTHSQWIGL